MSVASISLHYVSHLLLVSLSPSSFYFFSPPSLSLSLPSDDIGCVSLSSSRRCPSSWVRWRVLCCARYGTPASTMCPKHSKGRSSICSLRQLQPSSPHRRKVHTLTDATRRVIEAFTVITITTPPTATSIFTLLASLQHTLLHTVKRSAVIPVHQIFCAYHAVFFSGT